MSPIVEGGDVAAGPEEGNESLIYWVSWLATVSTLGLFSSGLLTIRKIHSSRSVGSVSHIPFVAASLNCSLWMTYGVLKPDSPITFINMAGLFLQLFYIAVYHTYVEMKFKIQRDFTIVLVTVLSISTYYTYLVSDHERVMNQMGVVCNIFTIIFFASPLINMAEVVRSKSTETMSFPLTVMSVSTTLSWVLYGLLVADVYVIFPNTVGVFLACIQLALFVMYRDHSKKLVAKVETPLV
ncbi:Sugar transporter SWEET1 [Geodia barretti]|uniref:Sugar transporter SWEET n=1 Tax=Geodia barretti TaxID=519541 RepID=A0AA35QUP4_GEOBA|nr:Sugar transporter SWEET1 [Geodia barretti]